MTTPFHAGFLLFPQLTQLDLTGPYEVLVQVPGVTTHLIWKTLEPVRAGGGLTILPTTTFADCPRLDLICVPGGSGVNALLTDPIVLGFLRKVAAEARYVTSVCTGALALGAAGLLRGRRATTHWMSHEMLRAFGAEPVEARVVVDGNLITGGGVTAGIDFGLTIAAMLADRRVAEMIQLTLEYNPAPPFNAGSPKTASADVLAGVKTLMAPWAERRHKAIAEAAARLAKENA